MATDIARAEQRVWEFRIEGSDELHRIPLAAYLPYGFVVKRMRGEVSDREFAFELLHEFCPELEDDGTLTMSTVMAIFEAWSAESTKDGASAGE